MRDTKPTALSATEFFSEQLQAVMKRQHITAEKESFDYLVSLLVTYMKSENFFAKGPDGKPQNNVLAELYADYLTGSLEKKKQALKRLGDICLVVSGIFPDSLKRKVVDVDYYLGMGGAAYRQLAGFHVNSVVREVFGELSEKFRPFSNVLAELSERSGLQSNADILRLYEKWLLTGNERLKTLLSEHGIATPVKVTTLRQ